MSNYILLLETWLFRETSISAGELKSKSLITATQNNYQANLKTPFLNFGLDKLCSSWFYCRAWTPGCVLSAIMPNRKAHIKVGSLPFSKIQLGFLWAQVMEYSVAHHYRTWVTQPSAQWISSPLDHISTNIKRVDQQLILEPHIRNKRINVRAWALDLLLLTEHREL